MITEGAKDTAELLRQYRAIREDIGVSDVSAMGKFAVSGRAATERLQYVLAGSVERMIWERS